jgi:crossover junction endodeoxyribonuclease RuvC
MRILGIDPGLNITGYGLLEVNGRNLREKPALLEAGVIKTKPDLTLAQRVSRIYKGIKEILEEFQPQVLVLEELYSHYRHPRTAILMGHARGVITLAAEQNNISLVGYRPSRIRKALLGQGNATKEQVQRMIQHLLGLSRLPQPEDISDALALALAHIHIDRSTVARKDNIKKIISTPQKFRKNTKEISMQ